MNIYADRGNLLLLERRCAWRGIGFMAHGGDARRPRRPRRARPLLPRRRAGPRPGALRERPRDDQARGAARRRGPRRAWCSASAAATSCSATATSSATRSCPAPGSSTCAPSGRTGPRLIGNVAIEVELAGLDRPRVLAGFENHGGRTHLGPGARPLGRVLRGHGNTGASGFEGVRRDARHRHLPPRPAAAEERVVRRLAGRRRRCAWTRRWPRSTTAGGRRARRRAAGGRDLSGSRSSASPARRAGASPFDLREHRPRRGAVGLPAGRDAGLRPRPEALPRGERAGDPRPLLRGPRRATSASSSARRAAARRPRCGWSTA